jgi:PIN domain
MAALKTSHVFLDTTVFDAANYSYGSGALDALRDLASSGRIQVHIGEVTLGEIKAHIKKGVADCVLAQREFESKARILRNSIDSQIKLRFMKLNPVKLETELMAQLKRYLTKTKINTMPLKWTSASKVFDAYFDKKLPFDEGKNKAEFPDAFTLETIKTWSQKHNQSIYVISGDSAFRSSCDNTRLLPLEKLKDFLDLVAQEDEERAQSVRETARDRFSEIEDQIKKQFEHKGFILSDEEGDVNDVNVTDLELRDIDILRFKKDSVEVEMEVQVSFTADVTYDDLENAIYDKEDDRYLFVDTIEKTVDVELLVNVTARILIDPQNPDHFKFDKVILSGPDTYDIEADQEGPYADFKVG